MYMRKIKYLAIALTLVEVILVSALVYDVLLASESASAYSYSPAYQVARADSSDSPTYGPSPQATYSPDDSYWLRGGG